MVSHTHTQYLTQHMHVIGNTTSEMSNFIFHYNKLHESIKKYQANKQVRSLPYAI